MATLRGYSVATPWLLIGYPPWLPSVATLRGYPPRLPLGLSRGYFPWRPSVATPCGYSAGGWRTLGAGAGRGRGLSAGGKRIITRRIASLRTRVGDSGWVPEGSLAGFFARHEPALALICGADRALASPRDQQPLKHQSCREPWGIMAQKLQLETSSATCSEIVARRPGGAPAGEPEPCARRRTSGSATPRAKSHRRHW